VIQSTTDNRVSSQATERAFARIGAKDKQLEWIEGAGHVITIDYGWQHVVDRMLEWMDTHRAGARKRGRPEETPVSRPA
jgi:esterase/lipase